MTSTMFRVVLALQIVAILATPVPEQNKNEKTLIMLELEPITKDDRTKRSSEQDAQRYIRQSAQLPPEYLNLLQQLSAQQQSTAGSPQQQQLIQELVVARGGAQQPPAAARYVLSHDGRLLEQDLGLQAIAQAAQSPQAPVQPGRPLISPELEAFSRLQTQLQQDYHDAPIRAQIAGQATRPTPAQPQQPAPAAAPESQAPQVFSQASLQAAARHQARLRAQLQGQDPNLIYGGAPGHDAQALLQQQLSQLAAAGQSDRQLAALYQAQQGVPQTFAFQQPSPAPEQQRLVYQQPSPAPEQQRFVYQQPSPAPEQQRLIYQQQFAQPQPQLRRPSALSPSSQAQLLPQNLAQAQPQYLVESSRQPKPQLQPSSIPQYQPQIQYVDYLRAQQQAPPTAAPPAPAASPAPQSDPFLASLLQPTSGRGLFTPTKQPSRSSIFVSRASSVKTPSGITIQEVPAVAPAPQKLPVVRIPTPSGQRPLSRAELDALVDAGFSVSPIQEAESQPQGFYKAKRQQPIAKLNLAEKKNHVVYQNHQDGVSYQYSPGGPTKAKKEHLKNVYKVENDKSENKQLVTYVLALDNPTAQPQ